MFLQNLRKETDAYHRALEQNHLSVSLMDEKVSCEDLAVYLEKLYGFVQPFESRYYDRLGTIVSDLETRKKAHLLRSDLAAMGSDADQVMLIHNETLDQVYPGLPELAGGLYVLEGSVLGGAIIHRHLVSKLGDYGGSYFPVYGKEISTKWKGFMQQLEDYSNAENEGRIIEGARQTFKLLNEWFG